MSDAPWKGRRLHLIGAGGAGMSGLALLARALGAEVEGCDRAESSYTQLLAEHGITVAVGHDGAHAGEGIEMVVSTAVPDDLPELVAAREHGARILHRSELLAEAAALRRTIAVSGTHGKTTTSAMVAHCLEQLGLEPGYAIGAELRSDQGGDRPNARWGGGEWFVAEADESDRSFLRFDPEVAVVTNLELDHHTTYASESDFRAAFVEFAAQAKRVIAWIEIADQLGRGDGLITFGIERGNLQAVNVRASGVGIDFDLVDGDRELGGVRLAVPGEHNVLNALAALAACREVGADLTAAGAALASFRPAGRRFELVGERDGARVYDDYAHHPTEVRATLTAARGLRPKRLIAVFQPHLYSRTLHLYREFGQALALADEVFVLDVYAARERPEGPFAGVTGKLVVDAVADARPGIDLWWLPTLDEVLVPLRKRLQPGNLIVTLGAGDVNTLGPRLFGGEHG